MSTSSIKDHHLSQAHQQISSPQTYLFQEEQTSSRSTLANIFEPINGIELKQGINHILENKTNNTSRVKLMPLEKRASEQMSNTRISLQNDSPTKSKHSPIKNVMAEIFSPVKSGGFTLYKTFIENQDQLKGSTKNANAIKRLVFPPDKDLNGKSSLPPDQMRNTVGQTKFQEALAVSRAKKKAISQLINSQAQFANDTQFKIQLLTQPLSQRNSQNQLKMKVIEDNYEDEMITSRQMMENETDNELCVKIPNKSHRKGNIFYIQQNPQKKGSIIYNNTINNFNLEPAQISNKYQIKQHRVVGQLSAPNLDQLPVDNGGNRYLLKKRGSVSQRNESVKYITNKQEESNDLNMKYVSNNKNNPYNNTNNIYNKSQPQSFYQDLKNSKFNQQSPRKTSYPVDDTITKKIINKNINSNSLSYLPQDIQHTPNTLLTTGGSTKNRNSILRDYRLTKNVKIQTSFTESLEDVVQQEFQMHLDYMASMNSEQFKKFEMNLNRDINLHDNEGNDNNIHLIRQSINNEEDEDDDLIKFEKIQIESDKKSPSKQPKYLHQQQQQKQQQLQQRQYEEQQQQQQQEQQKQVIEQIKQQIMTNQKLILNSHKQKQQLQASKAFYNLKDDDDSTSKMHIVKESSNLDQENVLANSSIHQLSRQDSSDMTSKYLLSPEEPALNLQTVIPPLIEIQVTAYTSKEQFVQQLNKKMNILAQKYKQANITNILCKNRILFYVDNIPNIIRIVKENNNQSLYELFKTYLLNGTLQEFINDNDLKKSLIQSTLNNINSLKPIKIRCHITLVNKLKSNKASTQPSFSQKQQLSPQKLINNSNVQQQFLKSQY